MSFSTKYDDFKGEIDKSKEFYSSVWKHAENNTTLYAACPSVIDDKGDVIDCDSVGCHGNVRHFHRDHSDKNPVFFVNPILTTRKQIFSFTSLPLAGEKYEEDAHMFIEWLCNQSAWRNTFLTKDPSRIFEDKIFIQNADTPSNLLIGGAIATRILFEKPDCLTVWASLVRNGVKPETAVLIAYRMRLTYEDETGKNFYWYVHSCSDHTPGPTYDVSEESVKNFINQNVKNLQTSFAKSRTYDGIQSTWGVTNKNSLNITRELGKICTPVVDIKKSVNPFDKAMKERGWKKSLEKSIGNITEYCLKLEKEAA